MAQVFGKAWKSQREFFEPNSLLGAEPLPLTELDEERAVAEQTDGPATSLPITAGGGLTCRLCGEQFSSRDEQATHFSGAWHRHNLRLRQKGKPAVSEEDFDDGASSSDEKSDDDDDDGRRSVVSSESSDDEDEDVSTSRYGAVLCRQSSQFYYANQSDGVVESVYRHVLPKSLVVDSSATYANAVRTLKRMATGGSMWVVLLLAGGRFAGTVFENGKMTLHKTFQRYTVRAKQGGAQSVRDQKQQKTAKSAGSTLRKLATIRRHGAVDDFMKSLDAGNGAENKDEASSRDASPDVVVTDLIEDEMKQTKIAGQNGREDEGNGQRNNVKPSQRRAFDRRRVTNKIGQSKPAADGPFDSVSQPVRQQCYTLLRSGAADELRELVAKSPDPNAVLKYLSEFKFPRGHNTYLHVAAKTGDLEMVTALLELGCDPAVRNTETKVPFQVSANKLVRRAFSEFRQNNSSRWDWNQSQIPLPEVANPEREAKLAEKKRKQRALKREKEKARKAVEAVERAENEERDRYLALSDREKRALAAERRLLASTGGPATGDNCHPAAAIAVSRCFQCATDISGKVPFTYSNNRFCSPKCVREHRSTE